MSAIGNFNPQATMSGFGQNGNAMSAFSQMNGSAGLMGGITSLTGLAGTNGIASGLSSVNGIAGCCGNQSEPLQILEMGSVQEMSQMLQLMMMMLSQTMNGGGSGASSGSPASAIGSNYGGASPSSSPASSSSSSPASSSNPSSSSSGSAPADAPQGDVKQWIDQAKAILEQSGIPASKLSDDDINIIIQHESSGNPHAQNNTDSNAAAGHPSKGLMQTIDSTFNSNAVAGHRDIWNPVDNIVAGVRYAVSRYGSLDNVPGVKAVKSGGSYVGY